MSCIKSSDYLLCTRPNEKKCKSCGAPIEWVLTQKGVKMPVNRGEVIILPDKSGSIVGLTLDGVVVKGNLSMNGTPGSVKVRISHFATCPKAEYHRRAPNGQ